MKITCYHGTHQRNELSISKTGFRSSAENEYLGAGIYFFEEAEFSNALEEAICFCRNVRYLEKKDIIVFRASVESEKVLDLVSNVEHRKLFDLAKQKIRLVLKFSQSVDSKVEDYRIFNLIDREKSFEVIRALIEAAKEQQDHRSYVVRRPQIQICVKEPSTIKSINIAWRNKIGRYQEWTTGKKP